MTEQAQFRIGGVYRDAKNRLYKLSHEGAYVRANPGAAWAVVVRHEARCWIGTGAGYRTLHDGKDTGNFDWEGVSRDLIPGELILRGGEWVSQDAPIAFPSGAVLQTCGDKIVGRTEPEPYRAPLPHFNQRTPHDPFGDGFVVTSGSVVDAQVVAPASANPLPANANLLRT